MVRSTGSVDYDAVAPTYDRRYRQNRYPGLGRALRRFVGARPGRRILEVGAGTGQWLAGLDRPERTLAGLDPAGAMLREARARLPGAWLVQGRAETLPWPAATFDRLVCINALHHFSSVTDFLAGARRVLRPGGGVLIVGLDPHTGRDSWCVYDYFPETLALDQARFPASATLRAKLAAAGFTRPRTYLAQHLRQQLPAGPALADGRLRQDSTSQLLLLSAAAYRRGLRRLRAAMAVGPGPALPLTVDLRLYATESWLPG